MFTKKEAKLFALGSNDSLAQKFTDELLKRHKVLLRRDEEANVTSLIYFYDRSGVIMVMATFGADQITATLKLMDIKFQFNGQERSKAYPNTNSVCYHKSIVKGWFN